MDAANWLWYEVLVITTLCCHLNLRILVLFYKEMVMHFIMVEIEGAPCTVLQVGRLLVVFEIVEELGGNVRAFEC